MRNVQSLMLIGRERGTSTISSVFMELLKAGINEASGGQSHETMLGNDIFINPRQHRR
jgi:hypothetical protein